MVNSVEQAALAWSNPSTYVEGATELDLHCASVATITSGTYAHGRILGQPMRFHLLAARRGVGQSGQPKRMTGGSDYGRQKAKAQAGWENFSAPTTSPRIEATLSLAARVCRGRGGAGSNPLKKNLGRARL
jgi:hypothetical protein